MWKCLVVIDDIWKGKKKKEILCVKDTGNVSVYTQKDKSGKKKRSGSKSTHKKRITYDELMIFDCFWFFTKHAFRWKRAKKKEKKRAKNKRETKEKREKRWGLYIFLSIRVSMSFDWEKTREHPKQRFLYPVVSIIWKNFKKKFNYRVTYDSAGMMCNFD